MQLIRFADCVSVPWKNGAGATREVWKLADDTGQNLIRISIAEISGNQPFSQFPGIDRVIMQLDGPAMELTIDGVSNVLKKEVPHPFPGEAQVDCKLEGNGLAHDLNLMCFRQAYIPHMQVVTVQQGHEVRVSHGVAAVLAVAPCTVAVGGQRSALEPWDCVVLQADEVLTLRTEARLVLLEGHPLAK